MKTAIQRLGFAILLPIFAFLNACDRSESSVDSGAGTVPKPVVKVTVSPLTPVTMRDLLRLPAESEPYLEVLVPADTGGRVEWIGLREGDRVKKGQLLAKVDVSALKAALERAEASFKLADEQLDRRKKLFSTRIINQEELDRSMAERAVALGSLRQARVEYERGFIRSPIGGLVNEVFVEQGEFIDRGKPLAEIVDVDRVKLNVHVPELDVRFLKPGRKALVRIDAFPEKAITGVIRFVAFKADPATKTFLVRVEVPNPGHRIRPGMIGRVQFLRRVIPEALAVPLFAIVDRGGERLVFVEEGGVARAREISIGVIEGDRVQVTRGLSPGDRLIVKGQHDVEEGMRVSVQ